MSGQETAFNERISFVYLELSVWTIAPSDILYLLVFVLRGATSEIDNRLLLIYGVP